MVATVDLGMSRGLNSGREICLHIRLSLMAQVSGVYTRFHLRWA